MPGPIEVFRSSRVQNQESLLQSFSIRGPKLKATYPEHYKQSQFDT